MNRSCLAFCTVILAYQLLAGPFAHADEVSDACNYVSRQVSTFKGGIYRQAPETFEDEGKIYKGCVVIVVGDRNNVPGRFPPADSPYPKPGSAAAKAGVAGGSRSRWPGWDLISHLARQHFLSGERIVGRRRRVRS